MYRSGRTRERTYVHLHVHSSRARARTTIRSTQNKVGSSQPYFVRAGARDE